jgi:streptogramin lyase
MKNASLLRSLAMFAALRFLVSKRPSLTSRKKSTIRPAAERLEDRCLLAVAIIEYPLPTPDSFPGGITGGPDGNVWFTESQHKIGRITPAGVITEFPVSSSNSPGAITTGPDGNLWFTEGSSTGVSMIGRITPAGVLTEFPGGGGAASITGGPDGNVWFAGGGGIGRITPSGKITEFPVQGLFVIGITSGSDGNLWFAASLAPDVGRITPAGVQTIFKVPQACNGTIATGPDGNVWFTEVQGRIGRITPAGVATDFDGLTPGSNLAGITGGPDGNVWFTESEGRIGQITPAGSVTEFSVPAVKDQFSLITTGPDGNLWFTEPSNNRIGEVLLHATPNQSFVIRVYQDLLQRPPDGTGFSLFTGVLDQGTATRTQVAQDIENSPEYQTLEVSNLYQSVLRRAVDASGLNTWVNYLAQGGSAEQLKAQLLGSDEYFSRFGGSSNSGYLSALYQDVLQRPLDPAGAAARGGAFNEGATRTDVAAAVLESLESDTNETESMYQQFLHRAADPGGLQAFVNSLQQGQTNEALIAFMIGSDEYFAGS